MHMVNKYKRKKFPRKNPSDSQKLKRKKKPQTQIHGDDLERAIINHNLIHTQIDK